MFVGSLFSSELLDLHRTDFSIVCPGPIFALDNGFDVDCTSVKFLDSFKPFGLPAPVTYTQV